MEDNNYQYNEQQPFDMHEISNPEPPKKPKNRFWLGLLIGALVGAALVLAGVVIYNFVLYRQLIKNVNEKTTYEYASYDEKLDTILQYLDLYYIGEFDEEDVANGLSSGLLSSIGDKYAKYYSKEDFDRLMEDSSGEYSGVGVSVVMNDDGMIEVYKVFPGTPAEEAGVHATDLIVEVDGVREFADLDALVALVRGAEGTDVTITFLRGEEEYQATLTRKSIITPSVDYQMLEDSVGYIYISGFDKASITQFDQAINALEAAGMTSLIIDVRDNPGGDYDAVVAMADRVLPEGTIITTKNKQGKVKEEISDEEHQVTVPMAVLINGNTASASELFSGAIQDYQLGTIIGETSYGKGVVQSIFRLNDGSGMKFTTETYYTPSGRCVDGVGVIPDIEVLLPDEVYEDGVVTEEEDLQLQKAIELLTGTTDSDEE